MELNRDDHEQAHRRRAFWVAPPDEDMYRIYGPTPSEMTPEWEAMGEVMATIVAHVDRGDGRCGGPHDDPPPHAPCGTRRWHEGVLDLMRRKHNP